MYLPAEAIDAILAMATVIRKCHRHEVPSPRGVADPSVFAASPPGQGNRTGPGSAVECVECAAAAPSTPYSAMNHFRDAAHAQRGINTCAKRFLWQVVVEKAFAMTEHCRRMTVEPRDVAEALELFVKVDAEDDWYRSFPTGAGVEGKGDGAAEEEDKMDQDWEDEDGKTMSKEESKEKAAEDDTFEYDASDSEDEEDENPIYIDDAIYAIEDAATPEFDAAFPPVDESKQMMDEQFCEEVLVPVLEEHRLSGYPRADGVDAMLKRAMYAFLVAKLS